MQWLANNSDMNVCIPWRTTSTFTCTMIIVDIYPVFKECRGLQRISHSVWSYSAFRPPFTDCRENSEKPISTFSDIGFSWCLTFFLSLLYRNLKNWFNQRRFLLSNKTFIFFWEEETVKDGKEFNLPVLLVAGSSW